MKLEALIRALQACGLQITLDDLRDIFWLATCIGDAAPAPATGSLNHAPPPSPLPLPSAPPPPLPPAPTALQNVTRRLPNDEQPALYGAAGGGDGVRHARRVQLRGAPALPHGLAIARALKPLSRRRPGRQWELDERASAEHIADTRMRSPVWVRARERWFDIVLAVDDVPTLSAWQPVVAALERLLHRQGGFRSVTQLLLSDEVGAVHARTPAGQPVAPATMREREGRRIVVVLSDCTADAWRRGAMGAWLQQVAAHLPVAVAPLLPASMWPHTAIGFAELRAASPRLAAPGSALRVRRPGWAEGEPGLVLPVLALEPTSVATWARMVAAAGDAWCAAALVPLPDDVDDGQHVQDEAPPAQPRSPAARAEAFCAGATADAQRLAAYFAVVRPLTPPVMRVIQKAMAPGEGASTLAQVFLGGLLVRTHAGATPDEAAYDFHPGLRERLQGGVTREEFLQVNLALHDFLQQQSGTGFDFFALLEDREGAERLPEAAMPFVQMARLAAARYGLSRAAAETPRPLRPLRPHEVAEIKITAEKGRFTFQYRSASRELSMTHAVKRDIFRAARALQANDAKAISAVAYELIPHEMQEALANPRGPSWAELVLDEATAALPWEMLFHSFSQQLPPALKRGLTRRSPYPPEPRRPRRERALVIGTRDLLDTRYSVPRDENVEVGNVAGVLSQVLPAPRVLVETTGAKVMQALIQELRRTRVLHFSGVGIVYDDPPDGGRPLEPLFVRFVFDDRQELTVRNLASMGSGPLPELVYLSTTRSAAVAPLLLRYGAQVVVAVDGAIDPQLATDFADVFYEVLANGQTLVEATQQARSALDQRYPQSGAWGQFQVWGDPGWRLVDEVSAAAEDVSDEADPDEPAESTGVVEPAKSQSGPINRLPALDDCDYLAFICHSRADDRLWDGWVTRFSHELHSSLSTMLSMRVPDVYLGAESFPASASITDHIRESIAASFAFVLVVSDRLLSSEWALRELRIARELYGEQMASRLYVVAISRSAVETLMATPAWREVLGDNQVWISFFDGEHPDRPVTIERRHGMLSSNFMEPMDRLLRDLVKMVNAAAA